MFNTLFQYIAGANSENENIDMTTPVSTKWQTNELHEECFYLNQAHQANPPKPTSPDVYIVSRPAMTVFTRKISKHFWHHMSVEDWMKESADLDKMIASKGFEVESDEMYINGYSSPMEFNQRSELWKIKKAPEAPKGRNNDLETVPYIVIETHHVGRHSFEERYYEGGMKWVCTKSNNDNAMFNTLFQYIAGANSENENIDMTTPVSTKWQTNELHEECFYLNQAHQTNPPEPTSPDVYEMIASKGFEIKSDEMYVNGYSSPWEFNQ